MPMLFILTIALQTAGALILLFGSLACRKKHLIEDCVPGSNVFERDENEMCTIEARILRKKATRKYRNVAGFVNLTLGYLLAAISPSPEFAQLCNFLFVILFVALILITEEILIRFLVKRFFIEDEKVPYETLAKYGADTIITSKELNEICSL